MGIGTIFFTLRELSCSERDKEVKSRGVMTYSEYCQSNLPLVFLSELCQAIFHLFKQLELVLASIEF